MRHLLKLALLLLAMLLPGKGAAHDFEVDGIYYNINGNEAIVTYKGTTSSEYSNEYSGTLAIPSSVTYGETTYPVTSIGDYAFINCSGLTNITIPNSVTSIGNNAFGSCRKLSSISLPNSLTTISFGAFQNCNELTSINIPSSVTTIGNSAFTGCSGLTRVTVASGNAKYDSRNNCNAIIETSSNKLLWGCRNSTIPNSITAIGANAFNSCYGLTNVTIPKSVTTIGRNAFAGCNGLSSVIVANDNSNYDSRNNCNAIIETATNLLIVGCKNTTIPNTVTAIGEYAFLNCYGLTSISIPNNITSIGLSAFEGCTGITSLTIPQSVTTIGDYGFYNCLGLTSISIPNSVINIGQSAFNSTVWYNNQPDGLIYAGLVAYRYKGTMPQETSIILRDGTKGIAVSAFKDCIGLTSITIPNSVSIIGRSAFSGCDGLTEVVIPNTVTSISDNAFYKCSGLTSITIPNSVTSIGQGAFNYCSKLTCVYIPNSVASIGNNAFNHCSALNEIYCLALLPPTIDSKTFSDYDATLYVPKESILTYQAANYWRLFSHFVPFFTDFEVDGIRYYSKENSSVSVIGYVEEMIPHGCELVIPESVTYEGQNFLVTEVTEYAFDGCYYLVSVVIPNTVTSIGNSAFQGCTELTKVTIGSGVDSIGAKAFNYCNSLQKVTCLGIEPPAMANADCFTTTAYNRATLCVEWKAMETYRATDYWYKFKNVQGFGSSGPGDVDGDGEVSIADITAIIDYIMGQTNNTFYEESADVNCNGTVNIADVVDLIDKLL